MPNNNYYQALINNNDSSETKYFKINNIIDFVSLYRKTNPKSRAVNGFTYYGSTGCRRKATCIYCRSVVATCSNKYPETKTFRRQAYEHVFDCQFNWAQKLGKINISKEKLEITI